MADVLSDSLDLLPFWDRLTEAQRELLKSRAGLVSFRTGETVHGGDTDCLGVLVVLSGLLRTYLLSEDGKEATIYRLHPGDICMLAASCILDAVTFQVQIDCEEDCRAILIPTDVFSSISEENIYVECFSYMTVTERFSDVISAVERMLFMSLEQRLAAFLLDEMARSGSEEILMTHEQIARLIGSAREAVSRILKQMSLSGLLELRRGGVRILDKTALYKLMG
ncbi:MAG: Crp/Fnr family transcriptional regulator [Clostridiales bacterium]|jgi:CRP/FNR family transcriptional regulator|nr:Crp/Fnr family transcriptional regulator [Clostridiales bacterium]